MDKFKSVKVLGHKGTWSSITSDNFNFRGVEESLYLMEHDSYGEEAACVVIDSGGVLIAEDCWNGFDDVRYLIDNGTPFSEWLG